MTGRDWPAPGNPLAPVAGSTISPSANGDSIPFHYPESGIPSNGSTMAVTVTRRLDSLVSESFSTDPAARAREALQRTFTGQLDALPFKPVKPSLPNRTPAEYHAVTRALGCTDLFAIDCPDRVVRERLIADVVRAADERVLVLSPDPAAVDRLAEALGLHGALSVVRALADDENPLRPIPAVNRLTSAAAGTGRVEKLRQEATEAAAKLEAELAAIADAEAALPGIRPLADRVAALDREADALTARRDAVEAEVVTESGTSFAESLVRGRAERDAACLPITAQRDTLRAERVEKEALLSQHKRHLEDAGKKPSILSRILGLTRTQTDTATIDREMRDLEATLAALAGQEAEKQAELDAADKRHESDRTKKIAAEVARRRAGIDVLHAKVSSERDAASARLAAWLRDVEKSGVAPLKPGESIDRIAADLAARAQQVRAELDTTRECLDGLHHRGHELAREFLAAATVVVATPGSLRTDPVFEVAAEVGFGLLVLDHAEELRQGDFLDLAPWAARWLLAGDSGRTSRPQGNGQRTPRHVDPHAGFFKQLVHRLDRDPWTIDADRLVCRLVHLDPDERRALSCEPVLDRPEIELRVSGHNGDAVLAEIVFPADTPIAEARRFLASQLDEVLLRPCGDWRWDDGDSLIACWPIASAAALPVAGHSEVGKPVVEEWIELEVGVKEKITGTGLGAFTAAIAFDPANGWDRVKAEQWLDSHLPRHHSRVAVL